MKRVVLATAVLAGLVLTVGPVFAAGGTKVCVPAKEGKPIVTPKGLVCKANYTLTELGAEGKEGKEGPKGATGEKGAPGFAGAVNPNDSIANGSGFTVSNPKTGEYELTLSAFGSCLADDEAPDTTATPFYEGSATMADVTQQCQNAVFVITVRIFNGKGEPVESGFAFISQPG
jgi:hypothetical protein